MTQRFEETPACCEPSGAVMLAPLCTQDLPCNNERNAMDIHHP